MAHSDFEEFIGFLAGHRVRHLVIGAHALAFHARPRATKDLDLYIEPSDANLENLIEALRAFFEGSPPSYSVRDLQDPDVIIQLGVAPVRIDLMFHVPGIASFEEAWQRREDGAFGAAATHYLGLEDLIAAKTAAGRPQDVADLAVLRRVAADRKSWDR